MIRWKSWHRWRTICLLAYIYLAVTTACHAAHAGPASDPDLIPVTVPELLRLLGGNVVPEPAAIGPTVSAGLTGAATQHQARQRWNVYADTTT